jgi:putative intracellular protease/amidase
MKSRILAIATNAAPDLNGHKTGLWLSELTHFLEVIADAGYEYDVASPAGGRIPIDEKSNSAKELAEPANARFLADASFRAALESSTACRDVDPSRYDAIYLAGGHGTMWDFRQSEDLQKVITAIDARHGYLTGVCHGVAGFIDSVDGAGDSIVRHRRITGFSNAEDLLAGTKKLMPFLLEDELEKNGADYRKNVLPFTEHVEIDGKLITGQNPQSARAVGRALAAELANRAR